VHFYGQVAYTPDALFNSEIYQTSISIAWTLLALGGMLAAKRREHRHLWIAAASLLGVVVGKLFLIDLGDSGTITRIVSFLSVGGLMLAIGYIAPIPPKQTPVQQAA
jgi:uncharacterized membrane protein